MAGWNENDKLKWRPLTPFGAEVDCDLRTPLDARSAARFAALFRDYGMIVARGQTLDMEQQAAVMAMVSPVLSGMEGRGEISSEDITRGGKTELTFHADYAFTPHPLDAICLHAVDVVDDASATRFANAERAYARLPVGLRERLAAYQVEMICPRFDADAFRAYDLHDPDAVLRETRPTVLVNPRTGRACLGVNEQHAARLLGLSWNESHDLLQAVYDRLYAADNIMDHRWRRGDLVVWDNFTFQHARASIEGVGRRILQRVASGAKGLWEMYPDLTTGIDMGGATVGAS